VVFIEVDPFTIINCPESIGAKVYCGVAIHEVESKLPEAYKTNALEGILNLEADVNVIVI
jgi:hypothetical protein